ncbi:MAG TPA: flippase [Cytophagales bacterium]|nr:flippase [Cytophagales bacterium]
MNTKKYWLNSGLYTLAERFSALVLGFGSFFILVRTASKETFGVWALFLSVTTLIELARNGLIQNALIKHLTTAVEVEKKEIMTASFVLNVILTSISALGLYFLAPFLASYWHSPLLLPMFRYYIFTTVVLVFFSQFSFIQQANFDFKGILVSTLLRQACFFLYILFVFVSSTAPDLVEMVNVQTMAACVGSLFAAVYVRKYVSFSKKVNWRWVLKLFHYGKFVFGTNISSVFFKTADQMILGNLKTSVEVGAYNATARISNLFEVPITSVASVVFPQSSKRIHQEGSLAAKQLYEKSVAVMLSLVLPAVLFVFLFPKFVLIVLTGRNYTEMAFVLQLVVVQNLFLPFLRQFGTILDSEGSPHLNFYFLIVNAALNILVNYYTISLYGVEGAATGSLIVCVVCTLFTIWYMRKKFGVSVRNTFSLLADIYQNIIVLIKNRYFYKK